jgi:hypothetical protein
VTTAVTMTAAAAGHVRRRRGAMARGGRGNRERAQERAREESVRAGRQEGGELWRSLCTLQWKGRGWDGACAAYVSVRAAEKRARLKKARTW